jgi:hypothetical protein
VLVHSRDLRAMKEHGRSGTRTTVRPSIEIDAADCPSVRLAFVHVEVRAWRCMTRDDVARLQEEQTFVRQI